MTVRDLAVIGSSADRGMFRLVLWLKDVKAVWKCGTRVRRVAQRRRNLARPRLPRAADHTAGSGSKEETRGGTCRPVRTHGDGGRVLRVVR